MAHFLGTVKGSRGISSRLGSKNSGLKTVANGWDFGVEVTLEQDQYGIDIAKIVLTGGSNGARNSKTLGYFCYKDLEEQYILLHYKDKEEQHKKENDSSKIVCSEIDFYPKNGKVNLPDTRLLK